MLESGPGADPRGRRFVLNGIAQLHPDTALDPLEAEALILQP